MKLFKYVVLAVLWVFFSSSAYAQSIKDVADCEILFSPKGGITDNLIANIKGSKHIRIMAYSFTSEPIYNALVKAKRKGADIEVIGDARSEKGRNAKYLLMAQAGIKVYLDKKHPIFHNKVMVFNKEIFSTGSFNFSNNAETANGENNITCHSVNTSEAYLDYFETHKKHSTLLVP